MRSFTVFLSLAVLVIGTACTQAPAEVNLKGQQVYGRSNEGDTGIVSHGSSGNYPASSYNSSYVTPPSVAQSTEQSAKVESIGVSDLSAPSPPAHNAAVAAAKPTAPAAAPASAGVNPWTNKPRPSELAGTDLAPPAPAAQAKPEQPVAQLDNIINSDNTAKAPPAPEKTAATQEAAAPVASVEKPAEKTASFIWPVAEKKVLSGFGPKGGGKVNDGVNIASAEGEPVWASGNGEVVYAGNEIKGYGNMVLIKHAGNKTTAYAHLSRISVDKYARVKQGDIIGYVGATGNVKEPQLHFVVRDGKEPVDPEKFIHKT